MMEELLEKIVGNYEWDGYTITSTEFVDHLGKTLKENCLTKQQVKKVFDNITALPSLHHGCFDDWLPKIIKDINKIEKELINE